jgi:hypothetical protein
LNTKTFENTERMNNFFKFSTRQTKINVKLVAFALTCASLSLWSWSVSEQRSMTSGGVLSDLIRSMTSGGVFSDLMSMTSGGASG